MYSDVTFRKALAGPSNKKTSNFQSGWVFLFVFGFVLFFLFCFVFLWKQLWCLLGPFLKLVCNGILIMKYLSKCSHNFLVNYFTRQPAVTDLRFFSIDILSF